ncbi:MAG TPA: hypothetical protein VJ891_09420 [Casimicrobiaceae bacterium]|nr:hypothetical protein [Casimicrobiaceae bacterium]
MAEGGRTQKPGAATDVSRDTNANADALPSQSNDPSELFGPARFNAVRRERAAASRRINRSLQLSKGDGNAAPSASASGAAPHPQRPEQQLAEAVAAKQPENIHAAATTPGLRDWALSLLAGDGTTIEQLVTIDKRAWLGGVYHSAITRLDTDVAVKVTVDSAAKAAFVKAAIDKNAVPFLLAVVGKSGGNGWTTAVTTVDYDKIVAGAPSPVADKDQYQGLLFLFGNGKGRSDAATRATFNHLYTSRILPPGDQSVVSAGGDTTQGANVFGWRVLYQPVAPDAKTMTSLMNAIHSIPQGQVNSADIAFVNQSQVQYRTKKPAPIGPWTNYGAPSVLNTSYYLPSSNKVVICASATGAVSNAPIPQASDKHGLAVGGSTEKNAPKMTFFMNHARHEIGHAVGARKFHGVGETGDEFAKAYGGWQAKSRAAFIAAYWNKAGKAKYDFSPFGGTKDVEIADAAVAGWMASLIETGSEPPGNEITKQPAPVVVKFLNVIMPKHSDQQLTNYFFAVFTSAGMNPSAIRDNAYQYPGFTPAGDDVFIYCTRYNPAGFVRYSKSAYSALLSSHGWYSLASDKEMFAEMYTNKYAGGKVPGASNGKDPETFFKKLEASNDSEIVPSDVPPQKTPGPSGGAAAKPESAAPTNPPPLGSDAKPIGHA